MGLTDEEAERLMAAADRVVGSVVPNTTYTLVAEINTLQEVLTSLGWYDR